MFALSNHFAAMIAEVANDWIYQRNVSHRDAGDIANAKTPPRVQMIITHDTHQFKSNLRGGCRKYALLTVIQCFIILRKGGQLARCDSCAYCITRCHDFVVEHGCIFRRSAGRKRGTTAESPILEVAVSAGETY